MSQAPPQPNLVVLASGGMESALMLHRAAPRLNTALYVAFGFAWEGAEKRHLRRLLPRLGVDLGRLAVMRYSFPVQAGHWARGDGPVPDAASPDEAVYLPARNLVLLTAATPFALSLPEGEVWLGSLRGNPFSDAGPAFLLGFQTLVRRAYGRKVRFTAPLSGLDKRQVVRALPPDLSACTFSCLAPVRGRHCGACNKCGERRRAFGAAGVSDPTRYA